MRRQDYLGTQVYVPKTTKHTKFFTPPFSSFFEAIKPKVNFEEIQFEAPTMAQWINYLKMTCSQQNLKVSTFKSCFDSPCNVSF